MTARVPGWAIGIMVSLLLACLALGIANDAGSLTIPSFALNLVSSMSAFSASGLFASALVNRYIRRRYWGVELNRRVAATARMELVVHEVAQVLDVDIEQGAGRDDRIHPSMPERAVSRLQSAIDARQRELARATTPEEAARVCRKPIGMTGEPWRGAPGATIAEQLNFVSDAQLLHATDRLDVKLDQFRKSFDTWQESENTADYSTLLRAGSSVASAIGGVIDWLVAAPGKRMTSMVRDGLRDSETRQGEILG